MKKMIRFLLFSSFISGLFLSPFAMNFSLAAPAGLVIEVGKKETHYSLSDLKSKFKTVFVTIDDPVYKTKKTYDGIPLTELFTAAGLQDCDGGDEIVFTAMDGYSPNTSFASLKKHRAILTYQEHGKKGFEKVTQGKSLLDPGPFYVVWENMGTEGSAVPWPYQLAKIEVVNFRQKYEKLFPKKVLADSAEMRGFKTFKADCIRCHSVNLEGGDVGPELNSPKNVTEYWSKENLRAFIRNAHSFRFKSKMPPFLQLKEVEIEEIIEYLEEMKKDKISG